MFIIKLTIWKGLSNKPILTECTHRKDKEEVDNAVHLQCIILAVFFNRSYYRKIVETNRKSTDSKNRIGTTCCGLHFGLETWIY
jgi:hypothetical protein